MSAAFDTIDHEILLEVLHLKFSFTGQALHWFDSYLRPRGFQVIIEGQRPEFINLPFSVPQGSCEGLCITLHMPPPYRNANQMTLNWTFMASLDDHAYKKLFDANSRHQEYKTMCDLSHCGSEIKTWMDHNRLKMNDSKTEFILFG